MYASIVSSLMYDDQNIDAQPKVAAKLMKGTARRLQKVNSR